MQHERLLPQASCMMHKKAEAGGHFEETHQFFACAKPAQGRLRNQVENILRVARDGWGWAVRVASREGGLARRAEGEMNDEANTR